MPTNRYLVPKSGWRFLDLAKAYGIGLIVKALSKSAIITDVGSYYEIYTMKELDYSQLPKIHGYLGEDIEEWNYILRTLGKRGMENIKKNMKKFFADKNNIQRILHLTFGGKPVTLPQSLEIGASKGIRKEIPRSYNEEQIKIPIEELYLATLGAINVSIWWGSKEYILSVYPIPQKTRIEDIHTIKTKLREQVKGFHKAGYLSSVVRVAMRVVKVEKELTSGGSFAPKIGELLYGVMIRTKNQPKPFTSGIFPLDILHSLIENSQGEEAVDKWIQILDRTSRLKGYEDIALTLSNFISDPSLENYLSYIRLHLKNELRRDTIKFGSYEQESLMEVMKNVVVE